MKIEIKKKHEKVILPEYATTQSAGLDLYADSFLKLYKGDQEISLDKVMKHSLSQGYIVLRSFERVLIGTGLMIALPEGYEAQIRPKSGITLKQGLMVMNSPGTIDGDYRGEIGVIIGNLSDSLVRINLGEKIAQAVIAKYESATWTEVVELSATSRGEGGFGSTGLK